MTYWNAGAPALVSKPSQTAASSSNGALPTPQASHRYARSFRRKKLNASAPSSGIRMVAVSMLAPHKENDRQHHGARGHEGKIVV